MSNTIVSDCIKISSFCSGRCIKGFSTNKLSKIMTAIKSITHIRFFFLSERWDFPPFLFLFYSSEVSRQPNSHRKNET